MLNFKSKTDIIESYGDNSDFVIIDGVAYTKNMDVLVAYPSDSKEKLFTIPDSVRMIEKYAFCGSQELEKVTIPESVKRIGDYAFAWCDSLESIYIHEKMESIGDKAFYGCNGMKQFIMHPKCKCNISICSALYCCTWLELLVLSDNFYMPFKELIRITYLRHELIESVTQSKSFLKNNCRLKVVARHVNIDDVPADEKALYFRGFIDYIEEYPDKIADGYAKYLKHCMAKWKPEIVNNTKLLAFALQNKLISKTKADDYMKCIQETGDTERTAMMMDYVQNNYGLSFDDYTSRQEITEKKEVKKDALEEKRKDPNADVKLVWSVKKDKESHTCSLIHYKGTAEHIVIPEEVDGFTVTRVGNMVSKNIKSIVLPDTVRELTDNAFLGCEKLESIDIGKGLWKLGVSAFSGCASLKEVTFPAGVNRIPKWLFRDCKNLEKVTFRQTDALYAGQTLWQGSAFRNARKAKLYIYEYVAVADGIIDESRIIRVPRKYVKGVLQ